MAISMIFPALKKKQFPEVVKMSYYCLGLMLINYYKEHKNFINIFLGQLEKKKLANDFREFDFHTLIILYDCVISNNMSDIDLEIGGNLPSSDIFTSKFENIIKQYLYFPDSVPRIISVLGLSKVLLLGRISKPKQYLARLISIYYKSFEIKEQVRDPEDYNTKVYEILNNFFFIYSITSKDHFNNMINSIIFLITTPIYNETLFNYNKGNDTTAVDFILIKFEFLNKLLISIINNYVNSINFKVESQFIKNNQEDQIIKLRKELQQKILLRILKRLIFTQLTFCDPEMCIVNSKTSKITLSDKENFTNEKENNQSLISFINQKNIIKNIKNLLEISGFSSTLINEFTADNEKFSIKLFSLIHFYNDSFDLDNLDEKFYSFYKALAEKEFITEINNVRINLLDSFESCKEYLLLKYQKNTEILLEEFNFLTLVKSEYHNEGINEEEDEELIKEEEDEEVSQASKKGKDAIKNLNQNSNILEDSDEEENNIELEVKRNNPRQIKKSNFFSQEEEDKKMNDDIDEDDDSNLLNISSKKTRKLRSKVNNKKIQNKIIETDEKPVRGRSSLIGNSNFKLNLAGSSGKKEKRNSNVEIQLNEDKEKIKERRKSSEPTMIKSATKEEILNKSKNNENKNKICINTRSGRRSVNNKEEENHSESDVKESKEKLNAMRKNKRKKY